MKIVQLSIFVVMALVVFAGCSTPATRINRNPEVFARLAPPDQQLIREGKIKIGFTPEMVRLALGDPNRIYARTDANGTSESWSYTTYETHEGVMLYRGYYHRSWADPSYPYYPYSINYGSRREREIFKVVFTGGRVSAIEQQT